MLSELQKMWISFKYVFNPLKPLMMARVLWEFLLSAFMGKNRLRYVDYSLGLNCNMQCKHCFQSGEKAERRMHPDYYGKVIKQAMNLGMVNASIQGGEPLIYKDLGDYIKAARPHMNLISVTTNGKDLSFSKAKELKRLGVDIVTISIDEFRSDEANMRAMDAIQDAKLAGLKVTVGFVVSHSSLRGKLLEYTIRLCLRGRIILMLIFACPQGALANKPEEMLTDEDVGVIRCMESIHPYVRTDMQANWKEYGCGAAKEILYITHDGETYCCPFIPISFGNVGVHSLKYIREQMLKVPELAQYYPHCIAGRGLWKLF